MNGTARKHGKTIGYVVNVRNYGVGTDCHGLKDITRHILLCGQPATIFPTRRLAQRAVRDTLRESVALRCEIVRVALLAATRETQAPGPRSEGEGPNE